MMRSKRIKIMALLMLAVVLSLGSFVVADITNITKGTSGYASIQAAIDAASANDTIMVGDGTYYEHLGIHKPINLVSINGAEATIIDAGGANDAVVHYYGGLSACVLDGFTITGGNGTVNTLHCGISGDGSYVTVQNCIITGNTGAIVFYLIYGDILNNKIVSNAIGGVTYPYLFLYCDPAGGNRIANNLIDGNSGGYFDLGYGSTVWENNIITNNTFWLCIFLNPATVTWRNNTFSGNNWTTFAFIWGGGSFPFTNNIVWGDTSVAWSGSGATPIVTNCNIQGYAGAGSNGNIDILPSSVFESGDYRLPSNSPCINAGGANAATKDYAGTLRDATADIGAFEYSVIALSCTNTVDPNSLSVSETGPTSDTYTVAIYDPNSEAVPTDNVEITVTPANSHIDLGAGAGVAVLLTFTPANYQVPQTVTVTAVDDFVVQGGVYTNTLINHVCSSTDTQYDGKACSPAVVKVIDNDVFGIFTVTESDGSTDVSEQGPTSDTISVVLASDPGADVQVIATPSDPNIDLGAGAGVAVALTFTSGDYATPQTVTVTAVDDTVLEFAHTSKITFSTASSNPLWDGITPVNVTVQIADNDCGVWDYDPMDLNNDCIVDVGDLAMLSASWMNCSMPFQAGCTNY